MRAKPHRLGAFIGRCVAAMVVTASPLSMAAQDDSELADAAARIQYAYFTADAHALTEVLKELETEQLGAGLQPLQHYQLAYGYWRLMQVSASGPSAESHSARPPITSSVAATTCAHHAQAAIKLDARFAEAYALDAICSMPPSGQAASQTAKPSTSACARHKSLRTAQELQPKNPRIQLIALSCEGNADVTVVTTLRDIVAEFGTVSAARPGAPDWGEPEALVMLGERYLQSGDSTAARDALERALVLAPDYRRAQELLQQAAARPR